jgi:hypothetical protein
MSKSTAIITQQNATREAPSHRRCEEVAAKEMTVAVYALNNSLALVKSTDRQAWMSEIDKLSMEAKRIRDAMYKEQGPLENL